MSADGARLAAIDAYIERLFVPPDAALSANLRRAETAGLPPIQVSPSEGKLLWLLTRMCGARRALEIGTLGGYSTTWLARGLAPGGTVVTLELSDAHAAVARASLAAVELDVTVDVRVGPAAAQLAAMAAAGEPPFDVVFIDADKPGYEAYLGLVMPLVRVGSLILADNVIRDGAVLDDLPSDDNARGAAAFNRAVATHPRLEAIVVPIVRQVVDGLAIALVVR
ncbi:MAG: O-methyltransferase [Acidobacteria bacterium]|nr:O-methyltransferase [Acidobacteriota bacterium]